MLSYVTGIDIQASGASTICSSYVDALSQCLINPVNVSQLLYSERCISEAILDEMETLGDSYDKKTTLLSAIQTGVSSDHKKLKALATVLSKFEETKLLSETISSDNGKRTLLNNLIIISFV